MSDKPVVTNLMTVAAKLSRKPVGRTNPNAKPKKGLASGLSPQAIQVFRLSKKK